MTRVAFSICCLAALAAACGDDSTQTDGGKDATTPDVAADVTLDAPSETTTADAASDAPADAAIEDASDASDDASSCDAGCKLFSYECKNGQFPACTCLAMSNDSPDPTCDAGVVNCFADPCQNKTPGCVAGHCVVK